MPLFIVFVLFPLAEIMAFATVVGAIGFLKALLLAVLMAGFGIILMKYQGVNTIFSAQQAMIKGEMPSVDLFDNLCIAAAGIMFILPGFISDVFGFALLVPFVRNFLRGKLEKNGRFTASAFNVEFTEFHDTKAYHRPDEPGIIEVEYETLDRKDKA